MRFVLLGVPCLACAFFLCPSACVWDCLVDSVLFLFVVWLLRAVVYALFGFWPWVSWFGHGVRIAWRLMFVALVVFLYGL